jgi:hypothetical protein
MGLLYQPAMLALHDSDYSHTAPWKRMYVKHITSMTLENFFVVTRESFVKVIHIDW